MITDRFDLVRQLPGGRHGTISQARLKPGGDLVALKQLAGADTETRTRLLEEVGRARALSDPQLVRSHSPVDEADDFWLVEDWVEGSSLAAIMAGSTGLTAAQALGVMRGVLLGLSVAHRAGVVHGELSPRSIMITTAGHPVLVGFAAHLAGAGVAGADRFASPAAMAGEARGARDDVFSVGAMLTELLNAAGNPKELEPVLARATATDAGSRHADAAALLAELEPAAERAYGAAWWTTAGLSGTVATTMASVGSGAAAGAAAPGGAGAITGTMSAGDGAIAGATHLAHRGAGAVKTAGKAGGLAGKQTALIIAGVAVVLVAVVVGAVAVLRPNTTTADPGAGAGAAAAPASVDPSRPAQPPTPTSVTPPAAGTFRVIDTVTSSNDERFPVGKRSTTQWMLSSSCQPSCALTLKGEGYTIKLTGGPTTWTSKQNTQQTCRQEVNGKVTGSDTVGVTSTFTLTVNASEMTGNSATLGARACKYGDKAAYKLVRSFNGTKIK